MVVYGVTANGEALCCDATIVSPLTREGRPVARAASQDGVALERAELRKRRTYHELVGSPYGRLVVLGCEVGGRWNEDAVRFISNLAAFKARAAPRMLQAIAKTSWAVRWWGLLSVAAQSALAATTLAFGGPAGFDEVPLEVAMDSVGGAPQPSRLPLRG